MWIKCPDCQATAQIADEAAYERGKCEQCGALFFNKDAAYVPPAVPEPPPPMTRDRVRKSSLSIEPMLLVNLSLWAAAALSLVLAIIWRGELWWVFLVCTIAGLATTDWQRGKRLTLKWVRGTLEDVEKKLDADG